MRIISGKCKGRKLVQLSGTNIRPTSDRTREAVFNIIGPGIKNKQVLDLFSGTGALGIEALSRGASHATFVDHDTATVLQNLERCWMHDNHQVIGCDIIKKNYIEKIGSRHFDILFIDPPYAKGYIESVLQHPSFIDLMAPDAIIIAEQSHKETLDILSPDLDIYRQKKYSKTLISFINKL